MVSELGVRRIKFLDHTLWFLNKISSEIAIIIFQWENTRNVNAGYTKDINDGDNLQGVLDEELPLYIANTW